MHKTLQSLAVAAATGAKGFVDIHLMMIASLPGKNEQAFFFFA